MQTVGYYAAVALAAGSTATAATPECYPNHTYDRAMAVSAEQLTTCQLSKAGRAYGLIAPRYPGQATEMAILFAMNSCGDELAVFRAVVAGCFSGPDARAENLVDEFHRGLMRQVEKVVRESAPR